jgi:L-ascorbate oxidase
MEITGIFVLHCHILGHEDRGMMQLVEVVSNKTLLEHYH